LARGFAVRRVTDMDGWLAYHAAFAAHSRHAEAEMRALGDDMAARITDSPALTELLRPPSTSRSHPFEHQP